MKNKLKKKIGILHLWLGLASGIVLFTVALTGSLLVFEKEIDQFINPEFYNVSSIGNSKKTIDYCTDVIQKQYAIEKINRIVIYHDPKRTMTIIGKGSEGETQIFSVDPYTGKVIGTIAQESRFFSVVLNIHRHLLMHDVGEIITSCSCLIFVFMLISGLILWCPKKMKNLKQHLTIKWEASFKRVNWDFHSTFGFYSFLFLLIIALTGLTWSFKWFENGMYFFADGTTKRPSAKVENPTKIIAFLVCLFAITLPVTGLLIWLGKRKKKVVN